MVGEICDAYGDRTSFCAGHAALKSLLRNGVVPEGLRCFSHSTQHSACGCVLGYHESAPAALVLAALLHRCNNEPSFVTASEALGYHLSRLRRPFGSTSRAGLFICASPLAQGRDESLLADLGDRHLNPSTFCPGQQGLFQAGQAAFFVLADQLT